MHIILHEPDPLEAEDLAASLHGAGYVATLCDSYGALPGLLEALPPNTIIVTGFPGEEFRPVAGASAGPDTCGMPPGACAGSMFKMLCHLGWRPRITARVWEAALRICQPRRSREQLEEEATAAFRGFTMRVPLGLTLLPSCWLAALPGLLRRTAESSRFERLPVSIAGLAARHGILVVEFDDEHLLPPEQPGRLTLRTRIRVQWNQSLYPSIWRPLQGRHSFCLRLIYPALCGDLPR